MTVTNDDLKKKKSDVLAKQLLAVKAQNSALIARNAVATAQGELQEMQAQKQIDDDAADSGV